MKPITVKSNLDLTMYYKISMIIVLKQQLLIISTIFFLLSILGYFYLGFQASDILSLGVSWIITFAIIIPLIIWFRCKANMSNFPVLAEGADIIITEDSLECISPSITTKAAWTTILKGTEYQKHFVLLAKTRSIYYFPKDGFSCESDIEKFKEVVAANNIKSNFK